MGEMGERGAGEVEARPREEPRVVEERTIRYQGFKSAEEAKQFLERMRGELESTERMFDQLFRGTRTFFQGIDRLLGWWTRPDIDREIEYHREQIRALEEQRKKALPEG